MATSSADTHPVVRHERPDGTITIYDNHTAQEYLKNQQSDEEAKKFSLLPLLSEFENFPQVNSVMVSYFREILTSIDSGIQIAPTVLFGALSELLIKGLVKASGDYLQDENTVHEFNSKRGQAKMDYTRNLVDKAKKKIAETRVTKKLSETEDSHFIRFYEIVEHVFCTIRIERNDLVHPELDVDLSNLPKTEVLRVQATSFMTYYKAILHLTNLILNPK